MFTFPHTKLRQNWHIILLIMLTVLPVWLVRFLPVYDYPQWVYQAHVLNHFSNFQHWYTINWLPVPNLGSTLSMLVLTPLFGAELGAKVLITVYASMTIVSFIYLVRGIVGGSAPHVELISPVVVYNYFFYNGFLSFILGIPVLLGTFGVLVRLKHAATTRKIVLLTLLSTLAYLCHLFIWLPICMYLFVVICITKTERIPLALSQLPPFVFVLLYAAKRNAEHSITTQYYSSGLNKVFSLVGPNLAIQRVDPFLTTLPILLINVVVLLVIVTALLVWIGTSAKVALKHPVWITCGLLILIALCIPFTWFAGMGAIDQRLTFISYVLVLALLGTTPQLRKYYKVSAVLAVLLLGAHAVNFVTVDQQLSLLHAAIQVRPADRSVQVVSLRRPPLYGTCGAASIYSAGNGIFPMLWFPLYDAVDRGGVVANTFNTAALQEKPDLHPSMLLQQLETPQQRDAFVAGVSSRTFDYIFVFGCPEDISGLLTTWQGKPPIVEQGTYFAILSQPNRQVLQLNP